MAASTPESTAKELLDQAVRVKGEMEERGSEVSGLGVAVIQLLSEAEGGSSHEQTRAVYAAAKDRHDRFVDRMLELSGAAEEVGGHFRPAHYRAGIEEVLDACGETSLSVLADEELIALGERDRDTVMSTPSVISAALASVYISSFSLALAHGNTLAAFLNRPSISTKLLKGTEKLLRAALLDLGGSVFPFLGTAEVLFQLATSEMCRDQERMRDAVEESDRLWFFIDQMDVLLRGAEIARGNARAAGGVVTEANEAFDRSVRSLVHAFGGSTRP